MIVCDKKEWKSVRSVDMSNADDTCPSLCAKPSDPEKGKWDCGEAELDPHFGLGQVLQYHVMLYVQNTYFCRYPVNTKCELKCETGYEKKPGEKYVRSLKLKRPT